MKSLSSKTYQGGVSIQGLTTLSGTVYLTGITNTASWDHVIVGTTAQGQIYTRTYAQFMGDVATGISLSSYVTGSGTTNYVTKWTSGSAIGNSVIQESSGFIGIGVSPSRKLHVLGGAGTSQIQSTGSSSTMYFGDANSSVIDNQGFGSIGNTLYLMTSGIERMRLDASGNLGIGTTSPSAKLEVEATSGYEIATGIAYIHKNYATNQPALVVRQSGAGGNSGTMQGMLLDVAGTALGKSFEIQNSGTARVTVLNNGNVGIGTTSPTAPLDTNGVRIGRNFSIANRATVRIDSNTSDYPADILFGHTAAANQTSWDGVYWSLSSRAASLSNAFTIWRGAGNPGGAGEEILFTILPNGNVGIGTTSPSHKLHLYGASDQLIKVENTGTYLMYAGLISNEGYIGSTNATPLGFYTNNVNRLYITTAGNVGIGTTSPAANLHIQGSNAKIRLTGDTHTSIELEDGGTGDPGYLKTYYYGSLVAQVGAGGTFFNTGDVGIGTASPSFKTTIAADITKSGDINPGTAQLSLEGSTTPGKRMILGYDTNSNGFGFIKSGNYGVTWTPLALQPDGGNVGIGTVSPSTKLDVSGVITATGGNSTNWNTAYGWGNHASASYVPQARTLTINGTSYDLSANRSWTIPTIANIQEAANNGKVTTAASVGTTVITTVATASYDGATFNYVLKDGTNYRAGTIIAVWSAGAVQFNETTTNDIGSTVGVTFAVALNAGNAELRATSATPGWTVKVVTIGI